MDGLGGKFRLALAHHDRGGLIWGYRLLDGAQITLSDVEVNRSSRVEAREPNPVWVHLNLSDGRARAWLSEHAGLPPAALTTLLDSSRRVRLEALPEGLAGIVDDLYHDFKGDPEGFGELRFYVDGWRIISGRRHPLKSIDALHRQVEQGMRIETAERWLEHFVESLARSFGEAVGALVGQVDALEDEIVAGTNADQRATLAGLRRLLVRFRRHIHADRSALGHLRSKASPSSTHEATPMRQALEHLDAVSSDLDLVHERVRLLQDEVAGLLAEATNRNLYVLSIVTTALLPATLITGFWGMNVGGLPWHADAHGGLWTGLTVLASIIFGLFALRVGRVL